MGVQVHEGQYEEQVEKVGRNQTSEGKCKYLLKNMLVQLGEQVLEDTAVRGAYKIMEQTHVVRRD